MIVQWLQIPICKGQNETAKPLAHVQHLQQNRVNNGPQRGVQTPSRSVWCGHLLPQTSEQGPLRAGLAGVSVGQFENGSWHGEGL